MKLHVYTFISAVAESMGDLHIQRSTSRKGGGVTDLNVYKRAAKRMLQKGDVTAVDLVDGLAKLSNDLDKVVAMLSLLARYERRAERRKASKRGGARRDSTKWDLVPFTFCKLDHEDASPSELADMIRALVKESKIGKADD